LLHEVQQSRESNLGRTITNKPDILLFLLPETLSRESIAARRIAKNKEIKVALIPEKSVSQTACGSAGCSNNWRKISKLN